LSIGIATKKTLEGGPPTTDMTYVMPEAESVICFSVPLSKELIRPYLAKNLPRGRTDFAIVRADCYLLAHKISKLAAEYLEQKGYKSAPVINNFKYREEDPDGALKMSPVLALRLVAARSGVGSVGWSGNILVNGHGAAVLLGALVTSVKLEPTNPIPPEESPCDKCKLCVKVCAFRMFDEKMEDSYTMGGYTFKFSKRLNVVRCYIVCGGSSGLDATRKWSTWSPGRIPNPETEMDVGRIFAHVTTHPHQNMRVKGEEGSYAESTLKDEEIVQDYMHLGKNPTFSDNYAPTCGNCQLICSGDKRETAKNYEILTKSGCVVAGTNENLENVIVTSEEANKMENEGKIPENTVETSQDRQNYEEFIFSTYKRLRNSQSI
jgi:epoxyqueuosine reductase QueG